MTRGYVSLSIGLALCVTLGCNAPDSQSTDTEGYTASQLIIDTATEGQSQLIFNAPTSTLYTQVQLNLGTNLLPTSICTGATILGIAGQAQCQPVCIEALRSNRFRTIGSTQPEQTPEAHGAIGSPSQGDSIRDVPQVLTDDEGSAVILANYTGGLCGQSGTLSARIADCSTHVNSEWNGSSNAHQGQSLWSLVSSNADSTLQVWKDHRTQHIWSSIVGTTSWCVAAGNTQTYTSTSCAATGTSVCDELGGLSAYSGSENFKAGVYSAAKGSMGLLTSANIHWRLPTLNDYRQAEVDGIRFVLPDMGSHASAVSEWTATVQSFDRSKAYRFQSNIGLIDATLNRGMSAAVRCIGSYEPQ